MKFAIQGKSYELESALQTASVDSLIKLKRATKYIGDGDRDNPEFKGVTVASITNMFISLGQQLEAANEDGADEFDYMDVLYATDDYMLNLAGLVWLARRSAGENPPLEEINDFPLMDFQIDGDDNADYEGAEVADGEDPKASTSSDPVASDPEPQPQD